MNNVQKFYKINILIILFGLNSIISIIIQFQGQNLLNFKQQLTKLIKFINLIIIYILNNNNRSVLILLIINFFDLYIQKKFQNIKNLIVNLKLTYQQSKSLYSRNEMKPIFLIMVLFTLSFTQNPEQKKPGNQNFIQPTVVHTQNSIPAQVHNLNSVPTQAVHNSEIPAQPVHNQQILNQPTQPTQSNQIHNQASLSNQNLVQPTDSHGIPSQPLNFNQNQQNQPSPNNQPQQQVLLSNSNIHGLEGQTVPIKNQMPSHDINQSSNQGGNQPTQQQRERSRQQADRARQMAQQARRQAQGDRKTTQQQQDQQLQKIQFDQTISLTQRKKQQQRLRFRKVSRQVQTGTRFTQYLFEQAGGASQFFIKIPATQQVAINLYTYVAQDNTYVRTKNIEQQQPVKIDIYENNERIVYEGQFYYQSYLVFQGKANGMYLMRIHNDGKPKLISMNIKKMVEQAHLAQTLKKHDASHAERTQILAVQVNKWYQQFRKIRMLDYKDLKAVQGYIQKYYSWEVIQTILAVILCAFQINLIRNMLKGSSIV